MITFYPAICRLWPPGDRTNQQLQTVDLALLLFQLFVLLGYALLLIGKQLRPVTWNWKERTDREQQLGLIAQEVETVLPELVTTDKDTERIKTEFNPMARSIAFRTTRCPSLNLRRLA